MHTLTRRLLPLSIMLSCTAAAQSVEEIIVTGVIDTHTVRTDDTMVAPADTAQLLRQMPGANINKNGELTGIAQYRGMYGDRMNVSINGAKISSGGPNAMDAPLHYAPVALLESLTINRGITPVSAGQETIGGNVNAETYSGDFGLGDDFGFSGRTYVGGQTVNDGLVASGFFSLSNRNHIFRSFLMKEKADDAEFARGSITPSEFDRERYDLGYSYQQGDHEFSIDYARNETGYAGNAALPMDIASVDSDLFNSRYEWQDADLTVTAKLAYNEVEHWMNNFELRRPPQDNDMGPGTMRYRQAFTTGDSLDASLSAERFVDNGSWLFGVDAHLADHNAVISNPNQPMFYVDNFKDVERNIVGAFIERDMALLDRMNLRTGLRYNRVSMDAGEVSANMNPMGMPSGMPFMMNMLAANLAGAFNDQELRQTDDNVDAFARLSIETDSDISWYIGAAHKSRSPSYQERYLWAPMESTGGLADGNTYIGDPDLKPETALEFEFGFDLETARYSLYPRAFYKDVSNYIQGTPSQNEVANNFAQLMANMGMGRPQPLQFSNVDATLYGWDVEAGYSLSERIELRAVASMVRGERDDIDDNLYRIAPDNLILAADYLGNDWMASLESVNYRRQGRVSATNQETETSGYSIVNLSGRFNPTQDLELGIGINNLLDQQHRDHLAGFNRAFNPDIGMRERLPGLGRNFYGRMMWYF